MDLLVTVVVVVVTFVPGSAGGSTLVSAFEIPLPVETLPRSLPDDV